MSPKYLSDLMRHIAPAGMPPSQRRRAVLRSAAALAVSAIILPAIPRAWAQPRFNSYPYTLGVASGSPRPDGFVLWTRLAPDPLAGGGMPQENVEIDWELAGDEGFANIVRTGTATATPELAHSAHVDLSGLEPGRPYWYRFMAGNAVSPIGRTRTAPAANAPVERLRFAFASCQQYEQGYYAAHRHMAAEDLDLVVFLGDYIYESSWGRNLVRKHNAGEAYTLGEYRDRYALYKSDPDLQLNHTRAPWLVTWDDHEVSNDYANDWSYDLDPNFLTRRAAAYQAFYEHMPLPLSALPRGPDARLYDSYAFGDLATFFVLDDRQYRSHEACPKPGRGGSTVVTDAECAERLLPDRTMLGGAQEAWLRDGLTRTRAKWNVIAQQTLMAQFDRKPGPPQSFWTDGWDGYPAARARLLSDVAQASNPLVIGGDVHSTWVADLKSDFNKLDSPVVATEFCGTSITSQGPTPIQVLGALSENPHLRYGNGSRHGYMKVEVRRDTCIVALRGLDNEKRSDSGIATTATFVVENGRPGAQKL